MVESPLRAIPNVTGSGLNQMNGKRSAADRIPADEFRLRATWRAVHAFNRANSNGIKKNEKCNKTYQPLDLALRFLYSGNCALLVCAFAAA